VALCQICFKPVKVMDVSVTGNALISCFTHLTKHLCNTSSENDKALSTNCILYIYIYGLDVNLTFTMFTLHKTHNTDITTVVFFHHLGTNE